MGDVRILQVYGGKSGPPVERVREWRKERYRAGTRRQRGDPGERAGNLSAP